jgi:hypothetical protein
MKKNLSGIVLAAEILAVILFHTFKDRGAENNSPENTIVRTGKSVIDIPRASSLFKTKPEYFFVNVLK